MILGSKRRATDIREVIDISQLPEDIAAKKLPGLSRIIGALVFRQRVVFIDGKLPPPRCPSQA